MIHKNKEKQKMRNKHRLTLVDIPKWCFVVSLFAFHFSFPYSANAQHLEHHRCWDIDLQPATDFQPPAPYIIAPSDSGLLLVAMAKEYLGTPYRYGGRTPKAFDCAGYALYLYRHFGHELPGWSGAQAKLGTEVSDTRNLQPGDLVFFGGRHNKKSIGHTGIVVDANADDGTFRFIHASVSAGVIISRNTEEYYRSRYLTARRLFR